MARKFTERKPLTSPTSVGFLLSKYLYKMKKNVDPIEHYGNLITEEITVVSAAIAAILFGSTMANAIKTLRKVMGDEPEVEAAIADYKAQSERLKDTVDRIRKEKKKRHTKK